MDTQTTTFSRQLKRGALLCMLGVLASCLSTTEGCGCSPPNFGVYLVGTVKRADGSPAPGLTIRSAVYSSACPAGEAQLTGPVLGPSFTDPQGRFRYYQPTGTPLPSACVRLRVFADTLSSSVALRTEDRPGVRVTEVDSLTYAIIVN